MKILSIKFNNVNSFELNQRNYDVMIIDIYKNHPNKIKKKVYNCLSSCRKALIKFNIHSLLGSLNKKMNEKEILNLLYESIRHSSSPFFFNAHKDMLLDFEREGKEGRETSIGCLSHAPRPGTEPLTYVCVLSGNRTHNLSVYRMMLQPTEPH